MAACSSEPTYLIEADALTSGSQRVRVSEGGEGIADARVAVNGALAAHESDGTYVVPQAPVLRVGERIPVEVLVGEDLVQGQAVVPAAPRLTAPAAGSASSALSGVTVTWVADDAPDAFAVVVHSGQVTKTFDVDGAARSHVLPASALPRNGEFSVEVLSVNRGVLVGPVAEGSRLAVRGESSPALSLRRAEPLKVTAYASPGHQSVYVKTQDDVDVSDAVVTINGQPATYVASPWQGSYSRSDSAPLPVGAELQVEVSRNGVGGAAVGRVLEMPVFASPADGTTVSAAAPLTVTWTSGSDTGRFSVMASWPCGSVTCGLSQDTEAAAGTARSVTIPAGTLLAGTDVRLTVHAFTEVPFVGAFTSNSMLRVSSTHSPARVLHVVP